MVRTERVSSTKDRDSMLVERARTLSVSSEDLVEASAVSKVAEILDAPGIVEYWKSSPYLLNFMRDYDLKKKLVERVRAPGADVRLHDAVRNAGPTLLKRSAIAWYRLLAPANSRMRALMDDVFGQRLEQNLWISAGAPLLWQRTPRCAADEGARFLRLVRGRGRHCGDLVLRGREAGGCWRRSAEVFRTASLASAAVSQRSGTIDWPADAVADLSVADPCATCRSLSRVFGMRLHAVGGGDARGDRRSSRTVARAYAAHVGCANGSDAGMGRPGDAR